MIQLTDEAPFVTLALSLHAPTQEMRELIVPSAKTYKLDELMEAVDYHCRQTRRRVMLEYCMLGDVNCGEDTAHKLGLLVKDRNVHINLIPFNPVDTAAKHQKPAPEVVAKFVDIIKSYGVFVTVRKEFGQDISGACGQLAVEITRGKGAHSNQEVKDIEDTLSNITNTKKNAKSVVTKRGKLIQQCVSNIVNDSNNSSEKTSQNHLNIAYIVSVLALIVLAFAYNLAASSKSQKNI
jgi:cyanate lyase